ncbi:helix-turn-helix domain-containing protein [Brassicibacter mesophilus]|uniref:helix-turn-helix domain-containing protein n=1 Tax=Brassicibacter mesophilus TaxID=745119 RepID=UPI003D25362C
MLKLYRIEHGIKQVELAELLGVNQFTLRSWEQKKAKPPYHIWKLFRNLCNDICRFS